MPRTPNMRGRELDSKEYETFINHLVRYDELNAMPGKYVNVPTVQTGLNEDGTIREEQIQSYAYEIINNKEE